MDKLDSVSWFREIGIVFHNALKDMIDEWVLTLCIVLSVAAIASPLLILFGLKQGIISTVRNEFITDPVYRQITPKETVEYDADFFENIAIDSRVEVVIPSITSSSSVAQVVLPNGEKTRNIDLHPTSANDPLILMNGGIVPDSGEVSLTAAFAQRHSLTVGQTIELAIGRRFKNKKQVALEALKVVSVLEARANNKSGLYIPLNLSVDIENYRFGRHVDRQGWPDGDEPLTPELFDGVFVGCKAPLDEQAISKATIRTEFKGHKILDSNGLLEHWPFIRPSQLIWNLFETLGSPTRERNVKALKAELRGLGCTTYLRWTKPRPASIEGQDITLYGVSGKEASQDLFPVSYAEKSGKPLSELTTIYLPESNSTDQQVTRLEIKVGGNALSIPVSISGFSTDLPTGIAVVPNELLARLRLGDEQEVVFRETSGEVIVGDLGYSGFRLYARSIDEVPALAVDVSRAGGVSVHAKTDDIQRVQSLDGGLTKIVTIVAIVGLIGGAGALVASLVASVERKKTEMGTYRLLGFSKQSVATFPVFQGVLIALLAIGFAGVFYYVFSGIVDQVVGVNGSPDSGSSSQIVKIFFSQYLVFVISVVILSILCASVASSRSMRIDPSEALRQE